MEPFTKVIQLGTTTTYGGRRMKVYVEIVFNAEGELALHGVEGPLRSGNALGSCGQIEETIRGTLGTYHYARGWNRHKVIELLFIWGRYHLNHMVPGSPRQMEFVRRNPELFNVTYPASHYVNALRVLGGNGLSPDNEYLHNGEPYRYGAAWLREEVPADVLEWLKGLPDSDDTPAWV